MEQIRVSELADKIGEEIESCFVIKMIAENVNDRTEWRACTVQDKTGMAQGVIWHECELPQDVLVYKVRAFVGMYQDKPRLQIKALEPASESEYAMQDFIPGLTDSEKQVLVERLNVLIGEIKEPKFKLLAEIVFKSKKFMNYYQTLPGGTLHHCYNGGLLLHTVEVAEITRDLCRKDQESRQHHSNALSANEDLCILAALLHDIGKCREYKPFPFTRREDSYFIGYQAVGYRILDKMIANISKTHPEMKGFYDKYQPLISNIILGSNIAYERYNVPFRTKEAMFVQMADKMSAARDAYDTCVCNFIDEHPESNENRVYSNYFKHLLFFDREAGETEAPADKGVS